MRTLFGFLLIAIAPGIALAQIPFRSQNLHIRMNDTSGKPFIKNNIKEQSFHNAAGQIKQEENTGKSPLAAALISGILPGAGQWYSGDKIKALGFVAAEIALWYGRSNFNDKGDEIERKFRAYADLNWNESDYVAWADRVDILRYSHVLPETKTQQYYELIGKYDQFLAGWPDSEGDPDASEMRLFYMGRQHESNKNYKRAERLAQLLVLNRVVSAVDAAFSIHRKNKNFSAKFRIAKMHPGSNVMPVVKFKFTW